MVGKTKYNYKEIETLLDDQIRNSGVIVMPKEINKNSNFPKYKAINEYYKKVYNSTYVKYYSDKGFKVNRGDYSYDEILQSIETFVKIHNKFPKTHEFKSINGLPPYWDAVRTLKRNEETLNDIATKFNIGRHLKTEGYDYWLEKFKNLGEEIPLKNITHNNISEYNLPSIRWFLQECTNDNVKNFDDFKRYELGYFDNLNLTKDEATRRINFMQSKANRPLMYDDFRDPRDDEVGITTVIKFWGTMNKMKVELGLEVVQESMIDRQIDFESLKVIVLNACREILKTHSCITTKEINANCPIRYGTIDRTFKLNGTTLRKFLENNNMKYQSSGTGHVHRFDDGEVTFSNYEYEFSKQLRNYNLIYGVDYFRDVRYKIFVDNYDGLLNCDYCINVGDEVFYVEVAGLLRDHKERYLKDITITSSKSKELYRKKLKQKEEMFKKQKLEYVILFPEDMKNAEEVVRKIINK